MLKLKSLPLSTKTPHWVQIIVKTPKWSVLKSDGSPLIYGRVNLTGVFILVGRLLERLEIIFKKVSPDVLLLFYSFFLLLTARFNYFFAFL